MAVQFPFSAVVGQHDLRLALLLNAVHPAIGGVLVRGEKGTAKSTVVRALAGLLPAIDVVEGCRFGCDPAAPDPDCPDGPHGTQSRTRPAGLVELPVGATEDRVIGSLDMERALTEGVRAYQPGLLAEAHRGVLYVDEVNLLHDHVVDLLLDAAAMGRAHVEREGVSVSHAARFLLVGTMNPEEGELRPQLLDRFGLNVTVGADREVGARTEVIRRRLAFEADPEGFAAQWAEADAKLAERVARARELLASVRLPDAELRRIASVCASFEVDGMRADLVVARTAVAHAAWRGAEAVAEPDVEAAVRLALPHRRRRDPFDEPGIEEQQLQQAMSDAADAAEQPPEDSPEEGPGDSGPEDGGPGGGGLDGGPDDGGPDDGGPDDGGPEDDGPGGGAAPPEDAEAPANTSGPDTSGPDTSGPDTNSSDTSGSETDGRAPTERQAGLPDAAFRARLLAVPGVGTGTPGKRSAARTTGGRLLRSGADGTGLHLVDTVRAAAPQQQARGRTGAGLVLRRDDVRHAVREGKESNLVLFAVDTSGSMAARRRMSAVTGAVISLLRDAYQRRDKVGVVSFRGQGAELVLPPTGSVDVAVRRLRQVTTGGRTPLAEGLHTCRKVAATERVRDPQRRCLLVVVTDGRATAGGEDPVAAAHAVGHGLAADGVAGIVVDCETGPARLGMAVRLAETMSAQYLRLDQLSAEGVAGIVRAA